MQSKNSPPYKFRGGRIPRGRFARRQIWAVLGFAYSVVDSHSATYFTGTSHSYEKRAIDFDVRQAFVGYSGKLRGVSFLVKAGQPTSAFGSVLIQYDDSRPPLLRPPGTYTFPP